MYRKLENKFLNIFSSSCKGVKKSLKKQCIETIESLFFDSTIKNCILNSINLRNINNQIYLKHEFKNIITSMNPIKRYFIKQHSIVYNHNYIQ